MNNFPPPPPGGQPPYDPSQQPTQVNQPAGAGVPPQPGAPQQYQQPVDPVAAIDKKRKQQLWMLGALAVVLIIGAFFGGKAFEAKNYEKGADGYNEIYEAGAKSGHAAGQKSGEAAGQKQGEESGIAKGTEQGKQEGEIEGTKAGAAAALGNLSNWSFTTPYVVTMKQGPSAEVPYAVEERTLMQPNTFYKVCASGSGVCTEEDTNSQSGGSGAGQ